MSVTVATFYMFTPIEDLVNLQARLRETCEQAQTKGTILIASEGLNATIAGSSSGVSSVLAVLEQDDRFAGMRIKRSSCDAVPFQRMKVRIKSEIVTSGLPDLDPTRQVGTYIEAQQWNEVLADPEITIIDTRNDFEVEMGSFDGAINPDTTSFREFADYVDRELSPENNPKVALFCTGGIRCEKATSYMLGHGYKDVYHLDGGILAYLENIPKEDSRWNGECFVFDERVSVTHGVEPSDSVLCQNCGWPLKPGEGTERLFGHGISCNRCRVELQEGA